MMNYDMQKLLEGATQATFRDVMDFSDELARDLKAAGEQLIDAHVLAIAISGVAQNLLDDEADRKAKALQEKEK